MDFVFWTVFFLWWCTGEPLQQSLSVCPAGSIWLCLILKDSLEFYELHVIICQPYQLIHTWYVKSSVAKQSDYSEIQKKRFIVQLPVTSSGNNAVTIHGQLKEILLLNQFTWNWFFLKHGISWLECCTTNGSNSRSKYIQAKHRQPLGLAYMENDKRQKQKL